MTSVGSALSAASLRLRAAGIDEPRSEAQLLLSHVLGCRREIVVGHPERPLSAAESEAYATALDRRSRREPISHIIGLREFWSLPFRVCGDVLDPRPDSETLVAAVLDEFPDRGSPLHILDLGTGSGCLLLALLHEFPSANGVGVDISAPAIALAEANAEQNGVAKRARFLHSDWTERAEGCFDVVVANPPYIATADLRRLAPEVACYEPPLALDGGVDGLAAYRAFAPSLRALLNRESLLAVEIGAGQELAVSAIFAAEALRLSGVRRDLGGINRCLLLRCA